MSTTTIREEIIRRLDTLPPNLQERVLGYVQALTSTEVYSIPGVDLLRFAGTISPEDIDAMDKAIEEGCEKVDPHGW